MNKLIVILILAIPMIVGVTALAAEQAQITGTAAAVSDQPYWGNAYNGKGAAAPPEPEIGDISPAESNIILQGGDNLLDAFVISSLPFHDEGTTVGYTNDWDPICCGGCMFGPDVVYSYSPSQDIVIDVNTCGGTFYDVLYIFENTDANVVACNSFYDVCPPQSGLDRFQLTGGNTYYLVVDGYWSSQGDYAITITEHLAIECPPEGIAEGEPDCGDEYVDTYNGGCNSASPVFQPIADGDVICGTSGTYLYNATMYRDTDWFRLELTEPRLLRWSAVAEFPAQIFIFDADTENCEDIEDVHHDQGPTGDTLSIAHNALPGIYYFFVSPLFYTGFDCPLTYTAWLVTEDPAVPPANDNCADVTPLPLAPDAPLVFDGDNTGATVDCRNLELIPEVWAAFTNDVMMDVKIEYCGTTPSFNGCYIVLSPECPCGELIYFSMYNQWECGDNNYTINWYNLPAGTYYFPIMSKIGEAEGPYHITVSATSVQPGIALDPTDIYAEVIPDGAMEIILSIANIGYGELTFSAVANQDQPVPAWLSIDTENGSIPVAGSPIDITVSLDAADLDVGTHTGNITVTSNAPDNPEFVVPVTLVVVQPDFPYLAGDANMFNEYVDVGNPLTGPWRIGGDVTFLVNFFDLSSGNQPCLMYNPGNTDNYPGGPVNGYYFASGDATGEGFVTGGDVTRLVNYFASVPGSEVKWYGWDKPLPQNYYPPQWLSNRGSGGPSPVPPLADLPAGWPNCQIPPPTTAVKVIPTGASK